MLVSVKNYFNKLVEFSTFFYGPRFSREEIGKRFHDWRKTKTRDEYEKNKIILDGARSELSDYSKQWKWIIIQAGLWLIISLKFEFHPVINVMAFFTVLTQFIQNLVTIAADKRNIFNSFITTEIIASGDLTGLVWEIIQDTEEKEKVGTLIKQYWYAPDSEWTDITIQLLPNKNFDRYPFMRIIIGHEKSAILLPYDFGLTRSAYGENDSSLLVLLKLFGRHSRISLSGHSSQISSIENKIVRLSNCLSSFFGVMDISPIIKDEKTGQWECYLTIDDQTNSWYEFEQNRKKDITHLLSEWVPVKKEVPKIDEVAESYKMKGYEW